MKVSTFKKIEKYAPRVLLACAVVPATIVISRGIDRNTTRTNQAKSIVQQYAPEKVAKLTKETKNDIMSVRTLKWEEAVKQIHDSLKIDSIAKSNYAKGAQMVRDSIKNANKIR